MLKGLPCLKKEQECKVNLVQEGEGWKTPEESWMDMEDARNEVYFVNILLGGKENKTESDEEMEREKAEAKVAVDASVRRGTNREGARASMPEGARMSDEEGEVSLRATWDQDGQGCIMSKEGFQVSKGEQREVNGSKARVRYNMCHELYMCI